MPAYSILAWLRRRRAVTRGLRHSTEAFRSAYSAFSGRHHSRRPPLLLPSVHWREMLRGVPVAALEEHRIFADTDVFSEAPPAVETVEFRAPVTARGAPRETHSREQPPRQTSPSRTEPFIDAARFVDAARAPIARQEVDSVAEAAASTRTSEPRTTREPDATPAAPPALAPREASSATGQKHETVIPTRADDVILARAKRPDDVMQMRADRGDDVILMRAKRAEDPLSSNVEANRGAVSDPRSAESMPASRMAASNAGPPSEIPADVTVTSPLDAATRDLVSESTRVATPTSGMPASPDVSAGKGPGAEQEVAPRLPRVDSPKRAASNPPHPPRTPAAPPAPSRQDRISTHNPPASNLDAAESKTETAIRSADVARSVELESASPTAAAPGAPIVASTSERVTAPVPADIVRELNVDDSLMTKVEARETELPVRAQVVHRDSSAIEIPVEHATPPETAPTKSIGQEAVIPAEREIVSPAPVAASRSDVKPEAAPVVERQTTPLANQPSGMRPTEERRSRRSRPAQPSEVARPHSQAATPKTGQQNAESPKQTDAAIPAERSMVDWRRLLFEATTDPRQRAAQVPSAPERATEQVRAAAPSAKQPLAAEKPIETEPLLESTRRFLRPRVGIDPATVPVVRGPIADQLIRDAGADAAAVADAVVLPSSFDERSPKDLGLLAHELTHVAQRRQPRFVPPANRSPGARPPGVRSGPNEHGESPRAVVPFSEEQLARRVERSVWNDAEQIAPEDRDVSADDVSRQNVQGVHTSPSHFTPHVEHRSNEWGGLPAPWEPFPVYASPVVAEASSAPVAIAATAGEQTIHYAEQGRSLEGEEPKSAHAAPAEAAPPPDLDALARRVYDVLKRRLAAERRREG